MPAHRRNSKQLQEENQELQNNLDQALADLHQAKKQAQKYRRKALQQGGKENQQSTKRLVAKPPSYNGKNGWHLRQKMGLTTSDDDVLLYNQIRSVVRTAIDAAGLDVNKPIGRQEHGRLFQCYIQAKEQVPYLRQFENDWATREIVKEVLVNRRKYRVRLVGRHRSNEDSDDEPAVSGNDGETGRSSRDPSNHGSDNDEMGSN